VKEICNSKNELEVSSSLITFFICVLTARPLGTLLACCTHIDRGFEVFNAYPYLKGQYQEMNVF
jgi:hypothetical protein